MKRYVVPLLVLFIVCILVGIWLELHFGETGANRGLMFQRAGALIVLLGTAYGFVDAAVFTKVGDLYTEDGIAKINEAMRHKDLIRMVDYKLDMVRYAQDARGELLKYEAAVLILGTIIWGFGDLFYRLF